MKWSDISKWWSNLWGGKKESKPVEKPVDNVDKPVEVPKEEPKPVEKPVEKPVIPDLPPSLEDKWVIPSVKVKTERNIEPKLEKMIDDYLCKYYYIDIKNACIKKDGNAIVALVNCVFSDLKVREKTNNNDGEMVELIQETIGRAEREPWCMAQQQSAIAYAEKKIGVASKVYPSEHCQTVAKSTPKALHVKVEESKKGDLWIWKHGTGSTGHVGNFWAWIKKGVSAYLHEGNTREGSSPSGVIVREGGGSYYTQRPTTKIGDMTLIAVVRPF